MKSHLLGLLSARDSIDVFKLEETDKYFSSQCKFVDTSDQLFRKLMNRLISVGSIEYDNIPTEKGCVRGWSYPSGIFIYKNE